MVLLLAWGFAGLLMHPAPDVVVALGAAGLAALGVHASVDYILHFPAVALVAAALLGSAQAIHRHPTQPALGRLLGLRRRGSDQRRSAEVTRALATEVGRSGRLMAARVAGPIDPLEPFVESIVPIFGTGRPVSGSGVF
jgi:hypothetical protein